MALYKRHVHYNRSFILHFSEWFILISIPLAFCGANDNFGGDIIKFTLHKKSYSELKVQDVLRQCLYAALLSTENFQLLVDLIVLNSTRDRCLEEVVTLFSSYKQQQLNQQIWPLKLEHKYCLLDWDVQSKNQNLIVEMHCSAKGNVWHNMFDNINTMQYLTLRLYLKNDDNNYSSFKQIFYSGLEKEKAPKILRRARKVETRKTAQISSMKLRTRTDPIHSKINDPFLLNASLTGDSVPNYNDSYWNDTSVNETFTNYSSFVTGRPKSPKDDLIFGYFKWYVLLILAIFVVILAIATTIACYYDCENRYSHLPDDASKICPVVTPPKIELAKQKSHKRMRKSGESEVQSDVKREQSTRSRTLFKRNMLIEAQQSSLKNAKDKRLGITKSKMHLDKRKDARTDDRMKEEEEKIHPKKQETELLLSRGSDESRTGSTEDTLSTKDSPVLLVASATTAENRNENSSIENDDEKQ